MHPIEWLRMVARNDDLPAGDFASEAAGALAGLDDDLRGIVPACRRLLERHSHVGPLWWVCARMLSADDPIAEARQIQADLAAEQVGLSLALDVPEEGDGEVRVAFVGWSPLADELQGRRPDLDVHVLVDRDSLPEGLRILVVDVAAAGNNAFLAPAGTQAAIDDAKQQGAEVWAGVEVARRLPEPLFQAMRQRVGTDVLDTVPAIDVGRIVEPVKIGCPCPPELLHLPSPGVEPTT